MHAKLSLLSLVLTEYSSYFSLPLQMGFGAFVLQPSLQHTAPISQTQFETVLTSDWSKLLSKIGCRQLLTDFSVILASDEIPIGTESSTYTPLLVSIWCRNYFAENFRFRNGNSEFSWDRPSSSAATSRITSSFSSFLSRYRLPASRTHRLFPCKFMILSR